MQRIAMTEEMRRNRKNRERQRRSLVQIETQLGVNSQDKLRH